MSEKIDKKKTFNEGLNAKIMHIRDHIYVADFGEPFLEFVTAYGVAIAIDMIKSYHDDKFKKAKDDNQMPSQENYLDGIYDTMLHLENIIGEEINSHAILEIKFDESKGHTVECFLAAADMLNDSKNWTPVGELKKNEPPEVVSVGEILRYPIDLTAFRWGCSIAPTVAKQISNAD